MALGQYRCTTGARSSSFGKPRAPRPRTAVNHLVWSMKYDCRLHSADHRSYRPLRKLPRHQRLTQSLGWSRYPRRHRIKRSLIPLLPRLPSLVASHEFATQHRPSGLIQDNPVLLWFGRQSFEHDCRRGDGPRKRRRRIFRVRRCENRHEDFDGEFDICLGTHRAVRSNLAEHCLRFPQCQVSAIGYSPSTRQRRVCLTRSLTHPLFFTLDLVGYRWRCRSGTSLW